MTKFSRWSVLRLCALIAAVIFIWCLNNDRLNPANWQAPLEYDDDVPLALATIKASSEGDYRPFLDKTVHRLGAPYDGNWNDWPSSGEVLIWVLGRFANWFGLLPASNLAVLLGFVSSAIAFYVCCRFLRFRREWAFVTALLFAFTFFHSFRGLHHL